jgi:FKBP-type peptidyl-prolyl cis-trans isomerase
MSRRNSFLFLLLAGLCFFHFSCKEQRIPGFRRMSNGNWFKLISLGESDRRPKEGEYLEMTIHNTLGDSTIYDSHLESATGTMLTPYNEKEGFSRLREGDSAVFLIPAYDLMHYGKDTMMTMRVRLLHIYDEKQFQAETDKRKRTNEKDEKTILDYFLRTQGGKFQALESGIYYQEESAGKGKNVERGDKVLLNYQGTFLNGKKFDMPQEPVEYTIGDEGQMLDGMALGLSQMKEGGKAKFIIPSHLAYGAEGSSTGIVTPFTTLVYEVELMKVN